MITSLTSARDRLSQTKKGKKRSTFTLTLTQPATVTLSITGTTKRGKATATVTKRFNAGANNFTIRTRMRVLKLTAGPVTVSATATNAAGTSPAKTVGLVVEKR